MLRKSPKSGAATPQKSRAVGFFRQGDRHRDSKQWAKAAESYRAGLELDPTTQGIWVQLGHSLKELGDLAEAQSAYSRALDLVPDDSDLHVQLGHLYSKHDYPEKALLHYQAAVTHGSTDFHALHWLAENCRRQGDWGQAVEWYEKLVSSHSDAGDAWVQLGHGYKEIGRFKSAEEAYKKAVSLLPQLDDVYLQLGHLYAIMNDSEQSKAYYILSAKAGSHDLHVRKYAPKLVFDEKLLRSLAGMLPDDSRREAALKLASQPASFARLILQCVQEAKAPLDRDVALIGSRLNASRTLAENNTNT